MNKIKKTPNISDYDKFNYDYKNYWNTRQYENKAERIILRKYLERLGGKYFVDIGGSFGRNLHTYYEKYETPIILDYSINTLQKSRKYILEKYPRTQLIAANAYSIPFKKNTMDTVMMIRVLHHLEDQETLLEEIHRITKNKGHFILEYANKMHLKAVLKWILTLKFNNFSIESYQQPNKQNFEGTENQTTIFLNFHSKYIENLMKKFNFHTLAKTNCSFLRIGILKKIIPLKILIIIEKVLQDTLSWTNLGPSTILKNIKQTKEENNEIKKFEDLLCCPVCKKDLTIEKDKAHCISCNIVFRKEKDIWDFRI